MIDFFKTRLLNTIHKINLNSHEEKMGEQTNIETLYKALEWGLDPQRTAWKRTLAHIETQPTSFKRQVLHQVRDDLCNKSRTLISIWYKEVVELGGNVEEISQYQENPEGLWRELYYMNQGVFGIGSDPLDGFLISMPSIKEGAHPMLLTPRPDGWGIPEGECDRGS